MMIAQRLYEAGHITYMRTDSLNLSSLAISTISNEIKATLGDEYLKVRQYHAKSKGAQEAHEAIRPTYIDRHTIDGTPQEKHLYSLIWKRTIASQMADALIEKTTVDIRPEGADDIHFTAQGEVIKHDGFLKVYLESNDDEPDGDNASSLPPLAAGDTLTAIDITATQRFTLAPARYTEASLVKKMEELGIGRPSTYAPTISTIQQREYVEKGEKPGEKRSFDVLTLEDGKISKSTKAENVGAEKGKLIPTDIGMVVNDFLTQYFPDILDYNFTAEMEEKFDEIANGNSDWTSRIGEFYDLFHPAVESANGMRLEHKIGERVLGTEPTTGEPVSVKIGRYGPVVQIGTGEGDTKPRFASLRHDQSVFDITLEEALKLFELPRTLGEIDGKEVSVAIGRFGPYVRLGSLYVSIPKTISPMEIDLDQARELIAAKQKAEAEKVVKTFAEEPDLQILNGRYGVYIAYKKKNYKIPKSVTDPAALTLEECIKIVEEPQPKTRKTTTRKATTTRKKS